jgi:cell division protein FtsB
MRLIIIVLTGLLLLIQYPLWIGKSGSWLHVRDLEQQVALAQKKNEDLKARNAKLESEVRDLKEGTGAIEERARSELGMIKEDEIYVQIVSPNAMPKSATPVIAAPPPSTTTTTAHPAKKPGH